MKKLVEDLVAAKRDSNDIVKKTDDGGPSLESLKEREPALLKKITAIAESIKSVFTDKEQDVIIDYITQIVNS